MLIWKTKINPKRVRTSQSLWNNKKCIKLFLSVIVFNRYCTVKQQGIPFKYAILNWKFYNFAMRCVSLCKSINLFLRHPVFISLYLFLFLEITLSWVYLIWHDNIVDMSILCLLYIFWYTVIKKTLVRKSWITYSRRKYYCYHQNDK